MLLSAFEQAHLAQSVMLRANDLGKSIGTLVCRNAILGNGITTNQLFMTRSYVYPMHSATMPWTVGQGQWSLYHDGLQLVELGA